MHRCGLTLFVLMMITMSFCFNPGSSFGKEYSISITVDSDFDTVWDKAIEFLVRKNFRITTIEKTSGLIVSEKKNPNENFLVCKRASKKL